MLYHKNQIIKRLQETEKDFLTEKELLALATPYINNISHVVASVKNALEKGYTGEYPVNFVSKVTAVSRPTLYRWEREGIINRKDNKLNISDLYNNLVFIQNRHTKN